MKFKNVGLVLSGAGALYVGLALHGGSGTKGSPRAWNDPVPAALAETSGTRLKAKVTTGADGSKLYDAEVLHDSTLDVDCAFHKASDGIQRCLPTVAPTGADAYAAIIYTDDKCMNGMIGLDPAPVGCAQTPPQYVYDWEATPKCGATADELAMRIYQVGALDQSAAGPRWAHNASGLCVTTNPPQGKVYYDISQEITPSTFVGGTVGTAP